MPNLESSTSSEAVGALTVVPGLLRSDSRIVFLSVDQGERASEEGKNVATQPSSQNFNFSQKSFNPSLSLTKSYYHHRRHSAYLPRMAEVNEPPCGCCSRPVTKQEPALILSSSQRTVHKSCFNCLECSISLAGQLKNFILPVAEYRSKGGDPQHVLKENTIVPLCEPHYKKRCGTFCSGCQKMIEGQFLRVGDRSFHSTCMHCEECGIQVNTKDEKPKIYQDVVRCGRCFDDMQYDKCVGCNQHIKAQFVRLGSGEKEGEAEGKWHPDCLTCTVCEIVLGGTTKFVAENNGIFCESCYRTANAPRCEGCTRPIMEESFLKIQGKSYHETCLACCVCTLPARDPSTKQLAVHSQDGAFYCKPHYVDAFAEKCAGCSFGMEGNFIVALDKKWHSECFSCAACGDCLVPDDGTPAEFCVENDEPYCMDDWDGLFGKGLNNPSIGDESSSAAVEEEEEDEEEDEEEEVEEVEEKEKKEEKSTELTSIANFDYAAADDDELELKAGDTIIFLEAVDEHWGKGKNKRTGEVGLYPMNYVSAPTPPTPPAPPARKTPPAAPAALAALAAPAAPATPATPATPSSPAAPAAPAPAALAPAALAPAALAAALAAAAAPAPAAPAAPPVRPISAAPAHGRKVSTQDIRKSAMQSGAKIRRATKMFKENPLMTTEGESKASQMEGEDVATKEKAGKREKNDEKKKKKKGPEWGAMIGSLFSQGIGHSMRKQLADTQLSTVSSSADLSKKQYKERFQYRLERGHAASAAATNGDIPSKRRSRSTSLTQRTNSKMFDFEDFAPACFRQLRNKGWGIDDASYMNSMCRSPLSGGQVGEGKSGMLFFFSHDKKYIVKTVTKAELPFFIKIMKDYHFHMLQSLDSLLSRFMGLYRMKVAGNKAMTVVVMQNLFYTNYKVEEKFDLKGSTVKRFVTEKEIANGVSVLKDLNFRTKIFLEEKTKIKFLAAMKNDARFLRESNIMDYSVLLGINNQGESNGKVEKLSPLPNPTFWQQRDGGVPAGNGRTETYFLGIIDILQKVRLF